MLKLQSEFILNKICEVLSRTLQFSMETTDEDHRMVKVSSLVNYLDNSE